LSAAPSTPSSEALQPLAPPSRLSGSLVQAQSRRFHVAALLRRSEFGALVAAVVVYAFFAVVTAGAGFVSLEGTAGWMDTAAELGIIAIPIGTLMIAGEFDLSIGSVVGAAAMMVAIGATFGGLPVWVMIGLALLMGAAVGLFNGLLTVRTGLPSFIVTLAANFGLAGASLGLARLLASTTTVSVPLSPSAHLVFASKWGQANVSILWWFAIALAGNWMLTKTPFGNWVFAAGGNVTAAKGAGVPTDRVKIVLFMATGAAAALVGVIQAIEFNIGNAGAGQGYVFQAPVVAVIGGVLLTGGYGSAFGVFLGTVIYGVIDVGIFYTGWSTDWVALFLAGLLLLAVLTNNYFRRLAMSMS
jgi:simple sugar transport system permease protein